MNVLSRDDNPKLRKDDRILVLKPIEGAKLKSSTGLVDPRLWKGSNELHAIMDQRSRLWYFKYSDGGLPEVLKQRFTTFQELRVYAEKYFEKRGLKIEGVED